MSTLTLPAQNANKASQKQSALQVKYSTFILGVTFCASSFFAILLCFYPGKEFLGNNFWPIFGLFAILALGTLIKIIFQSPILQIDENGIKFFRSKLFIPWQKVNKAGFIGLAVDGDKDDEKRFLVVQYLDEERKELMEIDFSVTGLMNKNEEEIAAALEKYYPGYR